MEGEVVQVRPNVDSLINLRAKKLKRKVVIRFNRGTK